MSCPVSDVDEALAHEESLTEPGCEQEPELSPADVEEIVHEELLIALMTDSPPRATFARRKRKGGPAEINTGDL